MPMEIVIQHYPDADKPTIVFGFTSPEFSQCVYLRVDSDPLECVKMANQIHEQFLAACGAAVTAVNERKAARKAKG